MKISIIGLGRVGITLAYTLILKQRFDQLVLVGTASDKAEGDALDLDHAQLFSGHSCRISSGSLKDASNSD